MDRALVERAQHGDAEAFDTLARASGDRCMAIAFRILRDADLADDAVQAALIVAWREIRTLREADRFEPWLHRILTRQCFAEAKRRRHWNVDLRVLQVHGAVDPGDTMTVDDRDQLERAFRRLTLEQRAVLVFHHYLGLPLEAVAERVGAPVGTVKSRLFYASRALRASIEADERTPTIEERLA